MDSGKTKMQTAGRPPSDCQTCGGKGKTKTATGGEQMCFNCRGTGKAQPSGHYMTK